MLLPTLVDGRRSRTFQPRDLISVNLDFLIVTALRTPEGAVVPVSQMRSVILARRSIAARFALTIVIDGAAFFSGYYRAFNRRGHVNHPFRIEIVAAASNATNDVADEIFLQKSPPVEKLF